MAKTALIQARVDEKIKAEAAQVLDQIGLTLSDAVRLLVKRVATDKKLPFLIGSPNAQTLAAVEEARAGNLDSADSVKDLFKKLNADD